MSTPESTEPAPRTRRSGGAVPAPNQKVAVITGASSGIGAAAARALAGDGWFVVVAARRMDRLRELAREIGGLAVELDVREDDSVAGFARRVLDEAGRVDLLVNNAGGALGLDPLAEAELEDWRWMYEVNVLGTVRVTRALREALLASRGLVIMVTSMAAFTPYPGGAGYNAAKFAQRALTRVLRAEEVDRGLRVCELQPGRVRTEEFSLNRFRGDRERAEAVYRDVESLEAEDIAESIRWVASLPPRVNVDRLNIMARDQA